MAEQILFDKLAYMDRLTRAGISEGQARAQAEALHEALAESVATKNDILMLKHEIQALEYRLTVRGGMMAAAAIAILASIKYFGG